MAEKIGNGARSRDLKSKLTAKGARNPSALAAHIGREKAGKARFQQLALAGKRRDKPPEGKPPPERPRREKV